MVKEDKSAESSLSVICSLVQLPVSLSSEFFPVNSWQKVYSSGFKDCPYAMRGGEVFCTHPGQEWSPCKPYSFLKSIAYQTWLEQGEVRHLTDEKGLPFVVCQEKYSPK